jgi:hypothetical protein
MLTFAADVSKAISDLHNVGQTGIVIREAGEEP